MLSATLTFDGEEPDKFRACTNKSPDGAKYSLDALASAAAGARLAAGVFVSTNFAVSSRWMGAGTAVS
ncbi:hypothetical protein SPIRO4BDMA_50789 [uncultured spirochete]|uniref:Uncharacterized protein n=1 Tax=uncultured spirochete TaxID=156406 RepID=A0A3P3XSZ3_9SPIR|nr:hypothetical protein SPIRO4BDMA_50789 [uncultured spirochete]